MNIKSLLAAAALVALLAPAAQAEEGFYLGAGVGANLAEDSNFDAAGVGNDVGSKIGYAGLISGGYQFDSNWRAELEAGYRHSNVDDITGAGAGPNEDGKFKAYSAMVNGIYGIPTGTDFTPYIGAGVGAARVKADGVSTVLGGTVDDSDNAFAYQGIAGVEYNIDQNLKADLGYRYFRTTDLHYAGGVDADYADHTVTVGLRYVFGSTPAPTPAPAPTPIAEQPAMPPAGVPNNYIVFFDFDSSTVTPEADQIVATAAANASQAKVTRLEVTGHTDRSGSNRYNQKLSQKRADAIKAVLVAKGIPADQIQVFAAGETQPLVATADGMREAQNRRVQIVLK